MPNATRNPIHETAIDEQIIFNQVCPKDEEYKQKVEHLAGPVVATYFPLPY